MASEGNLFGLTLKNSDFWFDTGKPGDYLTAQGAFLTYHKISSNDSNVKIDKTAKVE